ncbi:HNH endonuclease [Bacillus aquiflavi]|uniref:Putative HNH nuclease YajD n=1 Tax=Bacillus aquiflavi TaxID=2672567 RepID=A0A6B3W277_9BACI|nr:HNH endonuclease signature motif containing protein [Bacillus aquiflavi]MBA4538462.1 HNH endonuclease [Bacillus aquiflavi]NEY82825.1 HNH endonuclease [Bacillus aquiflavi]UAC48673.1 HNH endonuclease [Bacillus aquiflavi]
MPKEPRKPCKHNGCPLLTDDKYCEFHAKLHVNDRPNASERGYDNRWRKARKRFLNLNPLCKQCQQKGTLTQATVVDHIKPHRGDQSLFWDQSNWQPLCKRCHDRKTITEDRYPVYTF